MTSTPFNVGLTDNTRSSSRVLRPPGGGHTDIFGGEPEAPRGRRAGPPQLPTYVVGHGDEPKPTNGTSAAPQNGNHEPKVVAETPAPTPEAPKEITPKETPQAPKEIAPEAPKEISFNAPMEPVKADPPKRVRVPPGGFSSGLW